MSVRVSSWVWQNSTVTHRGDLLVLLALADHAHDDGGSAYPAVTTLAEKARLTRRGAQLALRRLEGAGAISIDGKGPRGTTAYRIVMGANSVRPEVTTRANSVPPGGELHARGGEVSDTKGANSPSPEPSVEPSIEPSVNRPARVVLDAVTEVSRSKGVSDPVQARVLSLCEDFGDVDLAAAARSFSDWWVHGKGRTKKLADPCRAMRNWLERERKNSAPAAPSAVASSRSDFSIYDQGLQQS